MEGRKFRRILAIAAFLFSSSATAVPIATYDPDMFLPQGGTVLNSHAQTLVGLIIDLGPDAGGDTPIWDTNNGQALGNPVGVFSNPVPGVGGSFFTVSFLGLSVATGQAFSYSGLDLDGFVSPGVVNAGDSTPFSGSETVTLRFADGTSASGNFAAAANGINLPDILFDSDSLVAAGRVPEPGSMAMLGLGLLGLGLFRRRAPLTQA